jgi:ribulose-phosphate 3-epimerase
MLISASVLSCDWANLRNEIEKLNAMKVDFIHFDVMDAHFVPNLTFGAGFVKAAKKYSQIPFEVHLMMEKPLEFVMFFSEASADTIIFHIECGSDINETIKTIKNFGKKVGIALKPDTPADAVLPVLKELDLVLVMTVEPGFGGQKFMTEQTAKIKFLSEKINRIGKKIILESDGGINPETMRVCEENGANACVMGSYIFKDRFCTN